ncbi:hypothetical protein MCOR27_004471 [Pyricularia oryzae]|uniref:WW domain-containing protein n=1 Tax=Pyricularia grisea TaxID=148305 RepID=A0ABQ8NHP6_PYRGI|nr:hypothetical protein MCOR01_001016 [Pyricularia oryzae]KAI6297303.1 hypothetical protein MCOR33_006354 [Pyricularia grisea]KAH9430469.1 hypothetical protein MCOR02_010169 [Pyricularia oryzae]KAI6257950.1 hypothetical protein MCOR19_005617 [Pyricularia oryzae]KAI6273846.1 hypothetical protein MCOR26_006712 [Pyricularia oryzae]
MGRWSHLDTDEERLPEGMVRIGYDADDETYTFRDERDGSIWESAPGCRYGRLRQISEGTRSNVGQQRPRASTMPMAPPPPYSDEAPNASFTDILRAHAADMARAQPPAAPQRSSTQYLEPQRPSWRHELMPLLHFFTLIEGRVRRKSDPVRDSTGRYVLGDFAKDRRSSRRPFGRKSKT